MSRYGKGETLWRFQDGAATLTDDNQVAVLSRYAARIEAIIASEQAPDPVQAATPLDHLRTLKAMLDESLITQEEYNAKKQELLNSMN